ncbi:MAG: FecR domain-containing protein [Bacteroidetes bacterium]|nr:FecR domain-containing protein [Bacteroidota bacterium]
MMEDRIRYLFRQYLENKCSRQELEEFFSYIRAAGHDEVLRNLIKKVYENTEPLPSIQTYVNEYGSLILTGKPGTQGVSPPRRRRVRGWLAAAALLMLIAAAPILWLAKEHGVPHPLPVAAALTKRMTERSEYKYLLLPDSTQVWLNASSTLEFPAHFTTEKREVTLSGEAYFDVRHSERGPFIIHTGKISTTVLGTSFNIKAYPDRQHVIVSVRTG